VRHAGSESVVQPSGWRRCAKNGAT